MKKILIVDDDAEFRSYLTDVLKGEGYRTESAASAKEAVALCEAKEFDIVLLDFMMPKMSGIDALLELRKQQPKTKVIMITAFATVENAVDAIRKGACDYIAKPFKIHDILTTVRGVLEMAKCIAHIDKLELVRQISAGANPTSHHIHKLHLIKDR